MRYKKIVKEIYISLSFIAIQFYISFSFQFFLYIFFVEIEMPTAKNMFVLLLCQCLYQFHTFLCVVYIQFYVTFMLLLCHTLYKFMYLLYLFL